MGLFGGGRKNRRFTGQTGVFITSQGLSLAHVSAGADGQAHLDRCETLALPAADAERSLAEGVRRLELENTATVAVIEQGTYHLLQVELPEVPESELKDVVRWRIKDLIDFPLEEAVVDVCLMPSPRGRGRGKAAYVVAARQQLVQQEAALLKAGRLRLQAMDIPELALRNLAVRLPEDAQGVALLYLGRARGLITLTRGGVLYFARNISLGLDHLERGRAAGPDGAGAPLEPMIDSIVLEVQRSLDYYESNFSQPTPALLALAPLEFPCPELLAALSQNFGSRAKPFPLETLVSGLELAEAEQARSFLAIGAALRREVAG